MTVKWQLNNSEVCLLDGFCQIRALTRKIAHTRTHTWIKQKAIERFITSKSLLYRKNAVYSYRECMLKMWCIVEFSLCFYFISVFLVVFLCLLFFCSVNLKKRFCFMNPKKRISKRHSNTHKYAARRYKIAINNLKCEKCTETWWESVTRKQQFYQTSSTNM